MPDWTTLVTVLGAIVAVVSAISTRRKTDAEAEATVAGAAMSLVKTIRAELDTVKGSYDRLTIEVVSLREEKAELTRRVQVLEQQLEQQLEMKDAQIKMLCTQIVSLGEKPWADAKLQKKEART